MGVIGLGYVGLSLATAFGRVLSTIGFEQAVKWHLENRQWANAVEVAREEG